jgi:hypothetical protein
MNQEIKNAYIDKMGAELKELSARVDLVKARFSKGAAEIRVDYHSKIEAWHKKENHFKKEMDEVRSSSAETFEKIKVGAQTAWQDLSSFVSENFEKLTENTKGSTQNETK